MASDQGDSVAIVCDRCLCLAEVLWQRYDATDLSAVVHVSCHGEHRLVCMPMHYAVRAGDQQRVLRPRAADPSAPARIFLSQLDDVGSREQLEALYQSLESRSVQLMQYAEAIERVLRCTRPSS